MNEDGKSHIDKLNETLDSRTKYQEPVDTRSQVTPHEEPQVDEAWKSPDLDEMLQYERRAPEGHPLMKKVFTFSVIFFILAIIVAGYMFLGGANFISSKNVDISIVGPTSVSAGEILALGLAVENGNNADLETVNLSIQYPQGTRDAKDTSKSITYVREQLGVIEAGQEATRDIKAVLFGSLGEVKEIKFSVEYKVKGSNATFYKDKVYEVSIGESPLSLTVEGPGVINSGDTFTTTLTVLSSDEVIKNAMLKAEYPYGYTVTETSPKAVFEQNIWSLGDLSPGDKKTITIKGRLVGENEEERTFRFHLGIADSSGSSSSFRTVITSMQSTVAIERSAVGISLSFGGETGSQVVAPAAQNIPVTVRFENNMPDKIINPRVEVKLSGQALDKFTVRAGDNGFYDSSRNVIVWQLGNGGQSELGPGEDGRVSFNFASLADLPTNSSGREIKVEATLTGNSISGGTLVTATENRVVKISSQVNLAAQALHSRGPFTNTGPIPPKAETETTYSIIWNVGNTQNDIENARVTARLGPGVKWVGAEGSGEDVAYDHSANIVTWDLGMLSSGAGFSTAGREAAFQVSITPSISQIGTVPTLVNSIVMTGVDRDTDANVNVSHGALTTNITSDPTFVQGDGTVVR